MIAKFISLFAIMFVSFPAFALGIDETYHGPSKGPEWTRFFTSPFTEGRSHAVLIGVSNYIGIEAGGFRSLDSGRDVEKVKKFLLEQAGFDSVVVITDEKATKSRIDRLMQDELPSRVGPKDRVIFYWSGHGVARQIGSSKQIGYLPLRDSQKGSYSSMISMEDIARWDGILQARQTLFLIDSCLSGLAGVQPKADVQALALEQLSQPGRWLFAAGTSNEETVVGAQWGGSLFTDAFVRGASGDAAPQSKVIGLSDILVYVRGYVAIEKERAGWKKTISPQLRQLQVSDGEFYFLRGNKFSAANVQPPKSAPGNTTGKGGSSAPDTDSPKPENRIEPKPFVDLSPDEQKIFSGTRIKIRYSHVRDEVALAMKDELIRLGARVCDFEYRSEVPEGVKPNVVYYEGGAYLRAAKLATKILKNNGVYDWAPGTAGYGCDMFVYVF